MRELPYYEVLWYNGWVDPPAYYVIDAVQVDTPEEALWRNQQRMTAKVRKLFHLSVQEADDDKIQETLYVLRSDGIVSFDEVEWMRRQT